MKIRTQLITTFFLLFIIPAFFLALLMIGQVRKNQIESTLNFFVAIAESKETELELLLGQYRDRLVGVTSRTRLRTILAQSTNQTEAVRDEIQGILQDALEPFSDVSLVALTTPGRQIIASTVDGDAVLGSVQQALDERRSTSDVEVWFDIEEEQLYMSAPVLSGEETLGFAVMRVDDATLVTIVGGVEGLGQTGEALVAARTPRGDARFLHTRRFDDDPNARAIIPREELNVPMTQALRQNETTLEFAVDYRNEPVVAVTRYIDIADWGLVVKIDRAELASVVTPITLTVTLLWSLVFLCSLGIAYLLMRSFATPIQRLAASVQAVSSRGVSVHVDTDILQQQGEIGILARTLDRVFRELADLYSSLEEKVTERTAALTKAQETLEQKIEETEKVNDFLLDREERIMELKKAVRSLEKDSTTAQRSSVSPKRRDTIPKKRTRTGKRKN